MELTHRWSFNGDYSDSAGCRRGRVDADRLSVINYVRERKEDETMSITLSVPPAVVQEARMYAEEHGTSLNAMIRDFLVRITTDDLRRSDAARTFREVAAAVSGRRGRKPGYKFSRGDAYDRGVDE